MSQNVRITADPLVNSEFPPGYTGSLNSYIGSIGFAGSNGAYTLNLNIDPTGFGGSIGYLGSTFSDVGIIAGIIGSNGFVSSVGWVALGFLGSGGSGGSGFTGSQGSTGFTGSIGFVGSVGPQGTSGDSGSTGFTGSASTTTGFSGSVGFTGSQGVGFTGSIGGSGITGFTGSQGSTGFTGSIGNTGGTGFTGSIGGTGFTGSIGNTGGTGFTGSVGGTGITGFTGSIGNTGFTGSIGFTGSVGFVGSKGFTGSVGFVGSQGATGFAGSVGNTGFTGSVGFVGSQGITGFAGSFGNTGFTGSVGFVGSLGSGQWTPITTGGVTEINGNTFNKTSGNDVTWDGQVYSLEGYVNGAFCSWQVNSTVSPLNRVIIGLNSDPTTDANYTSIDYGMYMDSTNVFPVIAGSIGGQIKAGYTTSTQFAITYDGLTVTFWADGVALATDSRAIGSALYLDSSFFDAKSVGVTNLAFGPMGQSGFTGSVGASGFTGSIGFTGSASTTIGFTGSVGNTGGTGFTGSVGNTGGTGFTGSVGNTGGTGFTGSASTTIGFTGSQGTGFTGSASTTIGFTGSLGFTGSSGASMPITAAASSDPSVPSSNNASLYFGNTVGAGSPAALRIEDALNVPYWLQSPAQSGRRVGADIHAYAIDTTTTTTLSYSGSGVTIPLMVANGGTAQAASTFNSWPWRETVILENTTSTSSYITAAVGCYFGNAVAGGGFFMRQVCGFLSNLTGTVAMVGVAVNTGLNMLSTTKFNGAYFWRDASTNSGNWSVTSDNGTTRSSNVNTTIACTLSHTYELLLYVPPNSTQIYWQVNDLTAGTTANGNFTGTVTLNQNNLQLLAQTETSSTGVMRWMGGRIEYDSKVV